MNEAGDISYSLNFRILCYYLISEVIEIPKVKLTAEAKRGKLHPNHINGTSDLKQKCTQTSDIIFLYGFSYPFTWCDLFCFEC